MFYARIENSSIVEYPLSEGEIKQRFSNVSWVEGDFDPPEGYVAIHPTNPPQAGFDEKIVEDNPVLEKGEWKQKWRLMKVSQEVLRERKANAKESLRAHCRSLLAACDWTQLPDAAGACDQEAWREYRQKLRDVSKQPGYPLKVEWPVAPE